MMGTKIRTFVGAGLIALTASLGAPTPAQADNFDYDGCASNQEVCWQTNKNIYTYYDANLPEVWKDGVRAARTEEYDPLSEWQTYYGSHADADVHYLRDDGIGADVMGSYFCSTLAGGGYCSHAHVRFNHAFPSMWQSLRKKVACHETGHSVGLHHRDPYNYSIATYGCLISGKVEGNYTGHLNSHNAYHMQNSGPY
ncbi:zinc metalloprotease [Aeromicrobium fastidiosum]|uniref:Matrixin family metalloprotease n=2 Tax=Aeromicrobium fastidiosum TaxID=52699 RepID=A0A641AIV5_9ACTN|nr:hypothetical protein [Aeromicrobium fastidiosum]KAA1373048.1 hypothetical protein ESP62_018355 [Aeromicrobium fastidiosum]MBP2391029.1 hypothetical protein [Aeromicrobium fastidiosum]